MMKVRQRLAPLLAFGMLSLSPGHAADTYQYADQLANARPVKVLQISLGDGFRERIIPGEVRASERATLSFRVSGQIASIDVHPGDKVEAGQLLASLDPAIYQQQKNVAEARFELARVLFKRASRLVEQGVVSRNDFDKSRSDYTVARAALDKANTDLTYTRLLAPYDGIISRRYLRQFEFAKQQAQVLGIQTESSVDVSFQLPEQFIGAFQSRTGPRAQDVQLQVQFGSGGQWFPARLKELNTVADAATASYTMVLTLPVPERLNVLPGMAAQVKALLPAKSGENFPLAPEGAVITTQGQAYVFRWLADKQQVEKVAVKIEAGRILEGLNDGDWLVIAGASELTDGQRAVRWLKERGL